MKLLLVEDYPAQVRLIREMLKEPLGGTFQIQHESRLDSALGRLRQETFDVVLLDLGLPDSQGMETLMRVQKAGGGLPIVVLTGFDDESFALDAVRAGAQDYLVKGRFDAQLLVRTIRHAVERTRAEAALRESERDFRTLAESVLSIVWATRPDGWNIYFNQQWVDYTGLTLEESYGHGWNTPFHPEDKPVAWEAWQRAIKHNEPYSLECRLRRADGVYRWWLIRGAPVRDANGEILKWFGTCTDIEEFKQSEEERLRLAVLRESEERFRTMANSLPQLAWIARADGFIFWYNRRWYEYTGATAEQMEGWGWQSVHDPEALPAVLEKWKSSIATGEPFEMAFPLRGADGRFRTFLTRGFPLKDAQGRVTQWFGTNTDVDELKRAEDALRERERLLQDVIDGSPSPIFLKDREGKFLTINASLERMLGMSREEIKGKTDYDIAPKEVADYWRTHDTKVMSTGTAIQTEEVADFQDGHHIFLANKFPLVDAEGQVYGVGAISHDITQRKQAEEALSEANEHLREADRRKDEFLAMLAHELRNPLAPVRNAVEIMKMIGPKDPVLQRNREMVERQVGHMARLLDDLLDVSRITRGKITLQTERLDLRTVVAQAIEVGEHSIQGRPLKIHCENPESPVWVNGDYTRLEQIVGNLLNNAIKYTDEGRIEVSLTCEPGKDGDCDWATVQVRDTGLGIPAEMLPHVFDLFVQADQSLDRRRGGLGIGLTMVSLLVQMHGGRVFVYSDGPGKGSVFTIQFPLAALPETKTMEDDAQSSVFSANQDSLRRILVVDDNEDAARSMAEIMTLWGFETETAYDGPTAVKKAMQDPPDVILLDIGLPGMNGYEVARLLRCEAGLDRIKIIALTGYGQDEARQRSKECGFDGHLVKPVDIAALQALLARLTAASNQ